jgi:hypothetical protein
MNYRTDRTALPWSDFIRVLALLGLLGLAGGVAAVSYHQFSICTTGTNCQECIERGAFSLTPDAKQKEVVANGLSPDGLPLMTKTKDCEFKDGMNWVCKDGRLLMTSVNGKVHLTYLGPPIQLEGRKVEVCLK